MEQVTFVKDSPLDIVCVYPSLNPPAVYVFFASYVNRVPVIMAAFTESAPPSVTNPTGSEALVTQAGGRTMLTLRILKAACSDVGVYSCMERSKVAQLNVGPEASHIKPNVTLPLDVIATEETTITCEGMTSSQGFLFWTTKGANDQVFSAMPVDATTTSEIVTSNSCSVTRRLTTTRVFDMGWNGTQIRCDTSQPVGQPDIKQMLVIPAEVCDGQLQGARIKHPYTCSRYMICLGATILVTSCPLDLCYDQEKDYCDHPPGTRR
ncbi:hypothetical protein V1264_009800 [Littorina saxatilis]|uniref:Chitin-binding type-2 domain-containing protein n=1 Tax=Littorina saxatilis TaxID=31220 RepID=A0AAN9AN78_9CAEN